MFDVSAILKKITDKGLSYSAVEKALGFGNGAIKRWSVSSPSIVKLYQLSNFLNIPLCELLGEKEKCLASAELSEDEAKVLKYYNRLPEDDRDYIKGEMVRLYKADSEADKENEHRAAR